MEYNILVAEDSKEISDLLVMYLKNSGYNVVCAYDGEEALEAFENTEIHLALLDIMMPKQSGYQVAAKIRENSSIPIIFLTAKSLADDKILGLDIGADDYITKPFNPMEVLARIRAMLRRAYELGQDEEDSPIIKVGDLELNRDNMIATVDGRQESLTVTEFKILQCLMKSPGEIFTKQQICSCVYGENYVDSDENAIIVHISKIRAKLEQDSADPKYIINVRGLGYKVDKK